MDPNEDFLTAAIRETKEEAGLDENKDYCIIDKSFNIEINYLVKNKPKRVIYWLAELQNPDAKIDLSDEHINFKWLDLDNAVELVKYAQMQHALKEAHDYLNKAR